MHGQMLINPVRTIYEMRICRVQADRKSYDVVVKGQSCGLDV
jgi:hypothetical protein